MFNWFGKRKHEEPISVPVAPTPAQLTPANPQPASSRPAVDPLLTMPAALHDSALTVPAALESLDRLRATHDMVHSNLSWLLSVAAPQPRAVLAPKESAVLQRLDAQLAARTLPANLLPRAAAVVPQLLGLMRREQPPRSELARQVAKDVLLTAEVFRVARSAAYGMQNVQRLEDALAHIGDAGLKQAMARVLMKPVFQAPPGGLIARVSPRLWLYAEAKSALCAELTEDPAQRLEAFLAGLMHDTGWIAVLRLLERARTPLPPTPFGSAFDTALALRKDRLFGRLTADWGLTQQLTALSQEMSTAGTAAPAGVVKGAPISAPTSALAGALAGVLRKADQLCLAHLAGIS